MDVEDVKFYKGKKVLIILKDSFKFTTIIPDFEGNSFRIIDKFGQQVAIDCSAILMIYEKEKE